MKRKYFGTDGIRGRVGEAPITPELVMKLGWAAGRTLAAAEGDADPNERPGVLIGKDTRISGYLLEAALEAGLSAAGMDVYLCGPLPTPGDRLPDARAAPRGRASSSARRTIRSTTTASSSSRRRAPSCRTTSKPRSRRGWRRRSPASRPRNWARRAASTTRPGATSNSARARFRRNSTCAGMRIVVDCAHGAGIPRRAAGVPRTRRGCDRRRRRARRTQHQCGRRRHASQISGRTGPRRIARTWDWRWTATATAW